MARPLPDSEIVVRAWELRTQQGMTIRAVASEMGISKSAAAKYISMAHEADAFVDHLHRNEARLAQAQRLAKYLRWIDEEEAKDRDKLELIAAAKWVEDRWAKLAGLDAPTRVQNENTTTVTEPPAELAEAVRRARLNAAKERNTITGGTSDDADNG